MAFIVEQLVGDRGIQIGNEDVIRPFSFGTNWSKIRVGITFAVNGYTDLPAGTLPAIGICTGNNARLSNTCTDAFFIQYDYNGATCLIAGAAPARYYGAGGTSNNFPYQRVGATTTNHAVSTGGMYSQFSANPTNQRTGFMFTVTKGVVGAASLPQLDIIYHTGGGTAGASDVSRGTFLAQLENESAAIAPMTYAAIGAGNLPLRFAKDWDSMFVNWPRSTPTMCIFCMSVVRFA